MKKLICWFSMFVIIVSGCSVKRLEINGNLESIIAEDKVREYDKNFHFNKLLVINSDIKNNILYLYLANLSKHKIIIHWNESVLIDTNNVTHPVYYEYVDNISKKLRGTNTSTVILPRGITGGAVNNYDNLVFHPSVYSPGYVYGSPSIGYHTSPGFYSPAYSSYEGLIAKSEKLTEAQESELYLNKPLKLMLVVEANGKKMDYYLVFKITEVTLSKPNNKKSSEKH